MKKIMIVFLFITQWAMAEPLVSPSLPTELPPLKRTYETIPTQENKNRSAVPDNFIPDFLRGTQLSNEIVILNTDKGFVPRQVRLKKGVEYFIHVVNVNEKNKNVSFILDGFSEYHATYFGKIKTFRINPKKEGIFPFISPETNYEGRLIVFPSTNRKLASEAK